MQFPTLRCSFLQSTTPSFWSPLTQKAHPSTSIAYHFDKHLISIPIYLLLLARHTCKPEAHLPGLLIA